MTETSPVATVSRLTPAEAGLDEATQVARLTRQGKKLFGVEMRIVGEDGQGLPRDGKTFGELQVRGQWVCSAYLGDAPGSALDADGWFSTGDVAVIHPDATMQITDRKKDLIKSGGEWISSIDLENAAARHPEVAMAAVIGVPHEKWGERPLLIVQPAPGASPTKESVLDFLESQVANLWMPDEVVFMDALPLGPTGKVQKSVLRQRYGA
jgi:fatty-acyl-CoA synthase